MELNKKKQGQSVNYEPIPVIIGDDLHHLDAILVRPLVGYIISNINLLAVK